MITSPSNRLVVRAARLKKRAYRERDRRFLVEGAQGIGEALGPPVLVEHLLHTAESHEVVQRAIREGVAVDRVTDEVMQRLTSTVTPQGLVAIARFVDVDLDAIPDPARCVAVLHAVRDPGNAGAVLRSADGAGADAVVFTSSSVDVYNQKTVRASAGSVFHLPIVRGVDTAATVGRLRDRGFKVCATAAGGEVDLFELDLTPATAFLFGNEAWGLPDDVADLADVTVRVPLAGRAESLNLAAAATLCLFEWSRQQREGRRVALESIIASAAHDIRSPLTAMKGFGYALAARWTNMTDEQRAVMLEGIVYDTDRLNTMVKQLVDAARVTSGQLDLFPELVDVGDLVANVAEMLGRDPELPEIVWDGGDVVATVDPDRLRMAIGAFVEAEAWWASEGPIQVTAEETEGRLRVEVYRRGTDLMEEDGESLFHPRPPGAAGGSKVGLFVARGVAEAQGGTATVEVADGLRFRLDIPSEGVAHPV